MTRRSKGVSYPTLTLGAGNRAGEQEDEDGAFKEVHDPEARGSENANADEPEIEAEETEDAPIKIARDPGSPTPVQMEEHFVVGHLPYRSWCPVCVMARGKEDPHHRAKKGEEDGVPAVVMDYKTFGQEIDTDDKATAIVMRDKKTTTTYAHICETKGASDTYVLQQLVKDIEDLGHTKIILKGDGEPALVNLMEKNKQARSHPTIIQKPPAYDPQASGVAERAVQEYMGRLEH